MQVITKPVKQKQIRELKLIGLNDWNCPIFKVTNVDKPYYLSDVENLFEYGTPHSEIKKFYDNFEDLKEVLTYHGRHIDDDPDGRKLNDNIELVITQI